LSSAINEDGDELIEVIEDPNASNPDNDPYDEDNVKDRMNKILAILSEREKNIVELYYGINGSPLTLEEIGEEYGLTKERIRQIKEKCIRKLRNNADVLQQQLFG
jgi:RNA polymerase primary sigma factor